MRNQASGCSQVFIETNPKDWFDGRMQEGCQKPSLKKNNNNDSPLWNFHAKPQWADFVKLAEHIQEQGFCYWRCK